MLLMDDMLIFFLLRILVVLITWISGFQYSKDTYKNFLIILILLISLNEC